MQSKCHVLGVILGCLLVPSLCFAIVMTSRKGDWPDTWPKELTPLRSQARTVQVAHGIQETVYEIPFKKRETFERAWPHILKVKSKGAPLILEQGPFTYNVSGSEVACGVMVLSPSLGHVAGRRSPRVETRNEAEKLVKQGKMLRAGPPWPKYLYSAEGKVPEYVGVDEKDGTLRWAPADRGNRARVDIILITDGRIIDLNRIQLPANTFIIDNRFKKRHNKSDPGDGK